MEGAEQEEEDSSSLSPTVFLPCLALKGKDEETTTKELEKRGGDDKENDILTIKGQKNMLLGDTNGEDGSICGPYIPSFAMNGEMGGIQEMGDEEQLKEKGNNKPYPHQEQCSNSSNNSKEEMEGFGHPRHRGDAVRGAAEEGQVIIDGHIATEEDEMTRNRNRTAAYHSITDGGGDSTQDGEVVFLEVREGKTGGSSSTTAASASLTPKKSVADICSIVSPLDHQGYCTTPSQEMVEQSASNQLPCGAGAGVHATTVTPPPQRLKYSSSSSVLVIEEEASNRKEKCNSNTGQVSFIQKMDEKDVDNAVSIAGDLADPTSISKCSETVPRNPYMDTNKIISVSESCKLARAQSAAAAAKAGDDDDCL